MFRYFAEDIAFILIKNKILSIKNREIYVYSIEVILLNLVLLLTLLGISILGNSLSLFFSFLLFFVPIRTFAGGYHARRSETCFGISVGAYIASMIIFIHFPNLYSNVMVSVIFIVAILVILIWSPLENPNHPLADYQYKRNKRILYGIVLIDILLFALFLNLNCAIASGEVIFIILASIFLIIGKIGKSKEKKEHLENPEDRKTIKVY